MKKVICSLCHGRGGDVIITCSNCNGSGYDPQDDNPFAQCHTCYGEGEENADVCPRCGGDGYYYVDEDEDEDEDVMGERVLPFMVAHPVGAVEDYIIT